MAVFLNLLFKPYLHPFAQINRAIDQSQPFITLVNWWFFSCFAWKNLSINYYLTNVMKDSDWSVCLLCMI